MGFLVFHNYETMKINIIPQKKYQEELCLLYDIN